MLKKTKTPKYPPPPSPPTVDEILEDMKTFHVDLKSVPSQQNQANTDGQLVDWWTRFEQAVATQKNLKLLDTEITNYKLKLETTKAELEKETEKLKRAIEEQQAEIKEVLEKGSG